MADLDALAQEYGDPVPLERVAALADELDLRREQAEADLRAWKQLVAENGSLKRRISALRGVLRRDGWKYVLEGDDDRRRRFELKQRKAARHG